MKSKSSWQKIYLNQIGTLERGKGLQKNDFTNSGTPCIHYGQIFTHYGGFAKSTISFVSQKTVEECSIVHPGDTILAITSENVQDLCKSTVWLGSEDIATGGHSGIFRHNQNPKFLGYFFQSEYFNHQKAKYAKGTKVIEINPEDILNRIKIKLPDLETQQKIVQILDTWNDAIELLNKRILSEKEKFAIFQHNLFMNSDYDKVPLGHLSTMHSGGTPNSKVADFYGGDVLWVSIADMTSVDNLYLNETKKHLTKKGFDSSSAIKIHPKGSVLYAMYASIGECVIAGRDMTSSQAILGINCKTDKLYNKYLYYYLTSNKQKIKTLGQQGTQSNLNAKMVKEFEIPLPPLEMQVAISKKLDAQVELIQYLEDNKKHYLTQYKYLLNHLISGDFDLTNIKLEKGKEQQ